MSDGNGLPDIFVRDLQARSTMLVSINRAGTGTANGRSTQPAISDDGRYVVFASEASDLADNDTNATLLDVFRRDLVLRKTVLVSPGKFGG